MSFFRELEIIGGGLAGLSLGLALRRAGARVAVHEAGAYPRHRVCGEFIAGLGRETITRLGLGPFLRDAREHREVGWFFRDRPPQTHRLPAPALGISRHALDARLADAFVAAGGELHMRSRIIDLEPRPGRVFAIGRRLARSPWLGLKLHARNLPLACDLEVHLGADAYVGLAATETGAVNVCGLFRRSHLRESNPIGYFDARPGPARMLAALRACGLSALAARLEVARVDPGSFCDVAGLDFDRHVAPRDRIELGDACAMIPPFTGNGMAMAFQSAELALDALLAYARGEAGWDATCRAAQAALRKRFRVRLASADALHPFVLRPPRQRWLAALGRARLLPFRPLYAALH